jgi:hypothetical protein
MPAVILHPLLDEAHDVNATVAISANTIKRRVFIFWYLKLKKTVLQGSIMQQTKWNSKENGGGIGVGTIGLLGVF